MKVEIIEFQDINSYEQLPNECNTGGKFGRTKSGVHFIMPIENPFFKNIEIGGYWASNKEKNTLYLWPKGKAKYFELFINELRGNDWFENLRIASGLE